MRTAPLFLIILISLIATGCATFPDRETSDWTEFSQAAPSQGETIDPSSEDYHRRFVSQAIENRDIVPGMTAREVVTAWGRPREVEVAGDGSRGNERWIYFNGNSTRYGISRQKMIYFENGRVTAWETR